MNDQHHDADDFWGRHDDRWASRRTGRTDRSDRVRRTPRGSRTDRTDRTDRVSPTDRADRTDRTDRRGGLTGRLRTGVHSVLDLGTEATREHRRVDAAGPRPADPASEADPTPVLRGRDLLDGWPDEDDVADDRAVARRAGGRRRAAVPPPAPSDPDDLSYGHDDRAYAGLSDLADGDPHFGAAAPAPGAAVAAESARRVGARRQHGAPATSDDGTRWGAGWEPDGGSDGSTGVVDPRLARFGVVAVVVTLLVPVVLGLRSDDAGEIATEQDPSTSVPAETTGSIAPAVTVVVADGSAAPEDVAATRRRAGSSRGSGSSASAGGDADPATEVASAATESGGESTVDAATAEVASCTLDYEVVSGDYWLRLADGAGVPLADLLSVNGATADTPIYPGSTICLPAGASIPPPPPAPTTAAAASRSSSGSASSGSSSGSSSSGSSSSSSSGSPGPSTAAPTTAAPTTAAPTTPAPTQPPTTAPPATSPPETQPPSTAPPTDPPTNYGPGEVQQLIRNIWPDRLEERALQIADRESNFVPTAKNYCCYGVFQIYWEVHKSWLSEMGVTSDQQLFDAETNIRAALALYRRSGGWGPWGF